MDSETALSATSTLRGATVQTAEKNDFSNTGRDTIKITVQNFNIDRRSLASDSEQAPEGNIVEDNEGSQPIFDPGGEFGIYSAISTALAAIFRRRPIQPLVVGEPTSSDDNNLLLGDVVTDCTPSHGFEPVATVSESAVTFSESAITVSEPNETISAPVVNISEPAVTVSGITAHDILLSSSSSSLPNITTERYTRSILDCQCTAGYPLYEPRPDSMPSTEYWKKGVRIGDVGIVTKDGIFDFLFNVCPSQNPSINPSEMPDDFEALECPEIRVMEQHFKTQTHLFNNTVNRIEEPSIRYNCLGPEGAILELPAGAALFEAKNSLSFKGLASRHAEKWYRYTVVTRGRDAPNGSLYLVTSCIKCTHWGIAVFDRPSGSQDYLQFVENEVPTTTNRNLRSKYDWKGSGAFVAKVAMDSDIPSSDSDSSNQCVFLRGYKIMLRKDVWDNTVDPHSTATPYMSSSPSSSDPGSKQMRRGGSGTLRREDGGGSETDGRVFRQLSLNTSGHGTEPMDVDTPLTTSSQRVIIQADFNVSPLHPSDLVNAVLLSQEPSAKIALTHDDDWWNLLRNHEDLTKLTSSYASAIDEYGSAFLELVTVPPPRDNDVTRCLRRPVKTSSSESPRFQPSGKGGCWTCRVRRKKCDEQWDGDSCSTCRRLEIVCLGSGPRRPDWLRDKHLVQRYRAQITETLTRAGRIRGQPRTPRRPEQTPHSWPYQRESIESTWPDARELTNLYNVENAYHSSDIMYNSMTDRLNGTFLPINNNDIDQSYFSYPGTSSASTFPTPESYTFPLDEHLGQEDNFATLSPQTTLPFEASDGYIAYFTHYLSHVQLLQPMLVGSGLAELTNSLITRDPNGAVAKAVCALSSLHMAQLKISQDLEPLEPNMYHSTATYFRDEASFLINSSLQLHGRYTANDAIAALHLVSFSQLSGGQFPWQDAFGVLCDRVAQSTLTSAENPYAQYENMSIIDQYIVKATLSLDVFASLSTGQSPRFLELMRQLLGEDSDIWSPSHGDTRRIRMEIFAGLPNNILLGIAEINELSSWKSTEINNESLCYRQLIDRGESIEWLLRDQSFAAVAPKEEPAGLLSAIEIKLIVDIFREGALQYLNGVISGYNPDIPKIKVPAQAVANLLRELRPSAIDQSLVFPTLITASLTDDLEEREHLKSRLQMGGNSSRIRKALDQMWRTRETAGATVDIQGIVKDAGLLLI